MSDDKHAPGEGGEPPAAPPHDKPALTVVGIGASAGGLKALQSLLSRLPRDSGLAFVIVVHLSPEHESHLADLLQPHCAMPVQQVQETMLIEADHVYVIPPNANLNTIDTHLRLSELEERRLNRAPIDHFFRTVAQTHDGHSIGIVLTGTGSDGTLGLRHIRDCGGLTIVQDPEEAEYDGMPRSAIAAGNVDLVLPVDKMVDYVLKFCEVEPHVRLPDEKAPADKEENQLLLKLFAQVRTHTGQDFSFYKRSTILRRIRRRMQLHQTEELADYLGLLNRNRDEVRMLFDDMLITVTEFFRDADVFERLQKEILPRLFEGKNSDTPVRLWSVGCATGEEAYSLAMLLQEEAERQGIHSPLQIFASDLHARSLQRAREGVYPESIQADIEPERLNRFFIKENNTYRVRKELREIVVFAPHNILKDPPFSHMDLVVCRNLLIYLQRDVQMDIIALFHYALEPSRFLLLGSSETVSRSDLFVAVEKDFCIYQRRNIPTREPRLPIFSFGGGVPPRGESFEQREERHGTYGALHEKMAEQYAPPSVLINPENDVIHVSANAGRYLLVPGGQPTSNLFRLAKEPLRLELRTTVQTARKSGKAKRGKPVALNIDGEKRQVLIRARPGEGEDMAGFLLVIFDEVEEIETEAIDADDATDSTLRELETELNLTRKRMQGVIEEYESSQEEMQASNEELQSSNEELRSTMEELETSREELQSMNEELTTLNQENRHRVEELSQLSSDLQNLLAATDIATLFLDRDLRIVRFTPQIGELFNIRHSDRGRPLSDLTHRLGYRDLQDDAHRVLQRLIPVEREVRSESGRWFLTRLLPYRTTEDRIEGVVITFIDITELKETLEALRESEERYRTLFNSIDEGFCVLEQRRDEQGATTDYCFVEANPAFLKLTGKAKVNATCIVEALPHLESDWLELFDKVLDTGQPIRIVKEATFKTSRCYDAFVFQLGGRDSRKVSMLLDDITERRQAERAFATELEDNKRLQQISTQLIQEGDVDALLDSILHAAIDLTRADRGTIQLLREDGRLCLRASHGFSLAVDAALALVDLGQDPLCQAVFTIETRLSIPDTDAADLPDGFLLPAALREAGVRAVQATPLRSRGGSFIGVIATHWLAPHQPEERQLRLLDNLARQATDLIERHISETALRNLSHSLEQRVAERTDQLLILNSRLRRLAGELASAEQRERKRLAAILHDHLQQLLVAARMRLNTIGRKIDNPQIAVAIDDARQCLSDAVEASRDLTRQLRPPVLYEAGLLPALEWLAGDVAERHKLLVRVDSDGSEANLTDDVKAMLFECVRELLFNVVKHAGDAEAGVEVFSEGDNLHIVVRDTGTGFDARTALDDGPTAGMGLFSVRERLAAFGGDLLVDSGAEGTRVTLIFPLAAGTKPEADHAIAPPSEPAADTTKPTDSKLRVLIADDHAIVRQGIANLVNSHTALTVVAEASDGVDAVAAVEQHNPDVVLLDLNMPRLNGIEATREIHRRWSHVHIIALSVQDDEATAKAVRDAGAVAFIPKSDDTQRLLDAILGIQKG